MKKLLYRFAMIEKQEEFKEALVELEKLGVTWMSGHTPTQWNGWTNEFEERGFGTLAFEDGRISIFARKRDDTKEVPLNSVLAIARAWAKKQAPETTK